MNNSVRILYKEVVFFRIVIVAKVVRLALLDQAEIDVHVFYKSIQSKQIECVVVNYKHFWLARADGFGLYLVEK